MQKTTALLGILAVLFFTGCYRLSPDEEELCTIPTATHAVTAGASSATPSMFSGGGMR